MLPKALKRQATLSGTPQRRSSMMPKVLKRQATLASQAFGDLDLVEVAGHRLPVSMEKMINYQGERRRGCHFFVQFYQLIFVWRGSVLQCEHAPVGHSSAPPHAEHTAPPLLSTLHHHMLSTPCA